MGIAAGVMHSHSCIYVAFGAAVQTIVKEIIGTDCITDLTEEHTH